MLDSESAVVAFSDGRVPVTKVNSGDAIDAYTSLSDRLSILLKGSTKAKAEHFDRAR